MRMGDRIEKKLDIINPDVWDEQIENLLQRLINYWYAVSNDKKEGVPTTGHTHDFGVYLDDVLAILVGESVSGSSKENEEVFKTIPGFVRALNFYTKVCGVIVGVDTVALMFAYFDRTDPTKIQIEQHQFTYVRGLTFADSVMSILYRISAMLYEVIQEAEDTNAEVVFTRALDVTFDRPKTASKGLNRNASVYAVYAGLAKHQWIADSYPLYFKSVHSALLGKEEFEEMWRQRKGQKRTLVETEV